MQIVETIRTLTEFLVYGEKYDKNYFEQFIDENVLQGDIARFLLLNNRLINIQIIQTTSMLIQNLENVSRVYYLLGNPFLNQLISHEFDFTKDDELVDYYVNFLKSLSIKLSSETVNFFFNDKLKQFPLFLQAICFFNHKEQLVRTSVQSIALTLFNIRNPEMQSLFSVLPFCQFYANVACRLRDIWQQMDFTIEQIASLDSSVNFTKVP
jgi:protein CLEC16A